MNKSLLVAVAATVLAMGSPAFADVGLTVTSEPAGATVMQRGQVMGTTPLILKMPTKGGKNEVCFMAAAISVRWPSGAEATTSANASDYKVCESAGKRQSIGFARPIGVPGAEFDFQYALQLKQIELLQLQIAQDAEAARRQQRSAEREARSRQQQRDLDALLLSTRRTASTLSTPSRLELVYPAQPVRCTSDIIGNTVHTTCR